MIYSEEILNREIVVVAYHLWICWKSYWYIKYSCDRLIALSYFWY